MKQQKYKKKIKHATTTSMEKITNTSATTTKYKIFRKQDSPQKQKILRPLQRHLSHLEKIQKSSFLILQLKIVSHHTQLHQ
jgi:hypothetical protein